MPTRSISFQQLFIQPEFSRLLPTQMYCRGFIFAVASCPEIPMPESWMPWLIKQDCRPADNTSFDQLAEGLMDGLREVLQAMREGRDLVPESCVWHADAMKRSSLSEWLTGLLSAHSQMETIWQQAWSMAQNNPQKDKGILHEEDPARRLTRCLKLFSTLANVELALLKRTPEQAEQLTANVAKLAEQLPLMAKEYVSIAGELSAVLPNQFESFTQPVGAANDPADKK